MTSRTKTFRSGNSQAIRLPAEIAYPEDGLELDLIRVGDQIIVQPAMTGSVAEMISILRALPELPHDMTSFERMQTRPLDYGNSSASDEDIQD